MINARRHLNFFSANPVVKQQEELHGQQIEKEAQKQQEKIAQQRREYWINRYGVDIKTGAVDPTTVTLVATANLEQVDFSNNNLTRSDFKIPSP
ncbi:MAG: hypothetical protein K0S11_230 [Gammaproteobacteria bacterium]|jgi:Zn/Cd-binding protein ZinT|nr:hypothetical protein [Gammaproteobacteria bacterium]